MRKTAAMFSVGTVALLAVSSQWGREQPPPVAPQAPMHSFGAVQPRIAPNGETIAFSQQGAIWRVPRTGGTMTRLTHGNRFDLDPVWSPDGKRIAYINSLNWGGGELRLMDAATGEPIKLPKNVLVPGTVAYYKLEFHPDNQRVLGVFRIDGAEQGLAWFNTATGNVHKVAKLPRWSRYALSRDGTSICYVQHTNVQGQQGGNDGRHAIVWKVPSVGGEPQQVLRFPSRIHDLCWAADDRSLYVVSELGGANYDVWHVPLTDDPMRSARQITSGQADEHRPSVSSDGRWLVYLDNQNSNTSLKVRDINAGVDETVIVNKTDFRKPSGFVSISVVDENGRPTTARVSVQHEDGKYHSPPNRLYRVIKDYAHFYCDEPTTFALPAGEYQLRALHGPEYRASYQKFTVLSGGTAGLRLKLARWTNQPSRGWYSGENHIHANYGYGEWYNTPETMLRQSAGENIHVSNFMVANSDTDGVFDRRFFRGGLDPLSTDSTLLYWNQEFRSTIWGHMTLVNLSQLVEPIMTGFKDTTNPWDIPTNSDIADRTHLQNGIVNYTHVAQNPDDPYQNPYTGKSIPIDVALGKIDSLDLNASYAGTVPLWYRLLNCGFRLTASAGTDCFLNRVRSRLPGGDRVYVQVDGPLTYTKWIEGLRAGRTFVTNGPMLELTVDGKPIGSTLKMAAPRNLAIRVMATAQFPLKSVEIIVNGEVIKSVDLLKDAGKVELSESIPITRSGWIALRATGDGHRDHPLGSQYAHTSPIYIQVGEHAAGSAQDAAYFLKWIDRIELAVRLRDRIPSKELQQHVRDQLEAARDVYRSIIEAAR